MEPVVSLLSRMIAFPTVSSRENASFAAFLAERLETLGLRVELLETTTGKVNLVATAGPPDTDGLILSGHMDVVPVTDQSWTSDPFVLREGADGRLYGRGATDMKGFLADVLAALARIDVSRLKKSLWLLFTHDEEVGCLGSAALVERFQKEGRKTPSAALIGEPTDFRIFRMHNGHAAFRIVAHGVDGHSSKPDLGANAILIAARALASLEKLAQELKTERRFEKDLERPYVVINPGMISGGSAVNIIPARCEVTVGFRPLPDQDANALFSRIQQRILEEALPYARSLSSEANVEVLLERVSPPMLTPEGTPLERALTAFARDPRPSGCPFCTDGGNFQRLGVKSLIFGPGSIDQAHRPDEYIERAQLERGVDVVERLIMQVCG